MQMLVRLPHYVHHSAKGCFTQLGNIASIYTLKMIGKREIVGHGMNGTACYLDHISFPMPAVRFKEPDDEACYLQVKEMGPWNKLTIHEKKALYRVSFCQTFTEMKEGTGEWKLHIGMALWAITVAIWWCMFCNSHIFPELPETFDEDRRKAQLKRMLDLEMNPIEGIASWWDYENEKWKRRR